MFTTEQKRQAVERELNYRRRVYKRMVEQGKMKQDFMDLQIELFEAIRTDYCAAEAAEKLI